MKSKENIVFLGMMGSGKTSIGKLISKKLNTEFFDVDLKIEFKLGMKISKIFALKGENFFRKQEEMITLEGLKKKNIVIALGGGGFLNDNIRKEILNNHLSFWLNWNSKILINRIINSPNRPIVHNATKDELFNLIKKRTDFYSKAMYKINCDNLTKNEIINEVIRIYETKKINS